MMLSKIISEKKLEKILTIFWFLFFLLEFNLQILSWRVNCFFCRNIFNILYSFAVFFFFCFLIFILPAIFLFFDEERKKFLIIFLFLVFFMFLSTFWSIVPQFSFFGGIQILLFSLPMSIITLSFKNPKNILKKLAIVFTLFGFLTSLFSLFLLVFGKIKELENGIYLQFFPLGCFQLSQLASINFPFFSIYSVFHNPNTFGFWLFITISFTFFLFLQHRKLSILILAFVQILAFSFTFSRASLLSLIAFSICFLFFLIKKQEKLKFFFLFFLIFLITFPPTFEIWKKKIESGLGKRMEIWREAFEIWKKRMFFGTGEATSVILLKNKTGDIHFHNSFIETLVELGIVGFLFYLFLWIYPIKIGLKKLKNLENEDSFICLSFIFSVLVGFFLNAFFESRIFYSNAFLFTPLWFSFISFLINPNFP